MKENRVALLTTWVALLSRGSWSCCYFLSFGIVKQFLSKYFIKFQETAALVFVCTCWLLDSRDGREREVVVGETPQGAGLFLFLIVACVALAEES
jgi:hypothetical protein